MEGTSRQVAEPPQATPRPKPSEFTDERTGRRRRRLPRPLLPASLAPFRTAIAFYVATRVLLLVVALVNGELRHHSFNHELANWDGLWYRQLANRGYPTHVLHVQSTLGFFPLYPIVIWLGGLGVHFLSSQSLLVSITVAGVIVSTIGGLVATVLVQQLGTGWWGEASGRRAAIIFSLFPGSVVFSMVYAEGILLPLAAGCLLALERRRWLLAGALAGIATAAEPEALVLVIVCAICALRELRAHSWRWREARGSLFATALSLGGVGAFAVFLWAWTGTPLATLHAQHYGWHEKTDPFALVHLAKSLGAQISFSHFNHPTINLNLVVGLLGAILLFVLLFLLATSRPRISLPAMVWTLGISFLAVTSEFTPPNPRLLITAFPAVMVLGHRTRGWRWVTIAVVNAILLAGLSALTFVGTTLRP